MIDEKSWNELLDNSEGRSVEIVKSDGTIITGLSGGYYESTDDSGEPVWALAVDVTMPDGLINAIGLLRENVKSFRYVFLHPAPNRVLSLLYHSTGGLFLCLVRSAFS